MKIPKESLSYLQDETDAPYEEGEYTVPLSEEDDKFMRNLFHSHGLTFEDDENPKQE